MKLSEKYASVLHLLERNYPDAKTELNYNDPYQLVVAVLLSAQCTDKRVNMVTPKFFDRFPDFFVLSNVSESEIKTLISSVTYPNSKSKHLSLLAKEIVLRFNGEIINDRDLLETLPGIGRKTANVIVSVLFNSPFIAVDTHVFRVSRRLGLSNSKTVIGVEEDLEKNIPEDKRAIAHHWLILHGRYVCTARNPKCESCILLNFCTDYHIRSRADFHKSSSSRRTKTASD